LGADTKIDGTQEMNWPGIQVLYLVLKTKDFIVCIDPDIDVDWETSDAYDQTGPQDTARHNSILNRTAALECIPNDHHKKAVRLNFKRMIAEGVARSLKHDYDGAASMLDEAHAFITLRNTEKARFWQLGTACGLGVLSAALGLALWAFRLPIENAFGDTAFFLLLAAVAGSLGGLLSMALRMGSSHPTSEAPIELHVLEAISRIVAGSISGGLIAACVKIGLILPTLSGTGHTQLVMVVVAVAAGASERWAPSLVSKMENQSTSAHTKKEGKK